MQFQIKRLITLYNTKPVFPSCLGAQKSEVWKVVRKTLDACNSARVKKLRIRAVDSYASLIEQKIYEVSNKKLNTPTFMKFMNKDTLPPVRVSGVKEQVQVSRLTGFI